MRKAKWRQVFAMALVALWLMPSVTYGGMKIVPQGSVSILKGDREVRRIQSEMPVPEGDFMICYGQCLMRTTGVQLVAGEKAVFAAAEAKDRVDVTVKSGRVDFALTEQAPNLAFRTPHDVIQVQEAIFQAASGGAVRGTVAVTEKGTLFQVHEGALRVATQTGTALVGQGQQIQLAAAELAPGGGAAGAGAGAAGAGAAGAGAAGAGAAGAGAAGAAAAGGVAAVGGALGMGTTALVATGVAVAGVTAGAVAAAGTGGDAEVSPSTPIQ